MSTNVRLVNPSDDQLDGAFAEHVVGLKKVGLEWGTGPRYWHRVGLASDGKGNLMDDVKRYCRSVDAILPYLEAAKSWSSLHILIEFDSTYLVNVWTGASTISDHRDKTLARAAVVALLRAHGMEITFT